MKRRSANNSARRRKPPAIHKRYTKTEILDEVANNTSLERREVDAVLNELGSIVERHIRKRAAREFILPGLLKIQAVKKAARPARKNVPNPFKPRGIHGCAAQARLDPGQDHPLEETEGLRPVASSRPPSGPRA